MERFNMKKILDNVEMVIIMVQQENALHYLNNVTLLQPGMVLAVHHQEVELFALKEEMLSI